MAASDRFTWQSDEVELGEVETVTGPEKLLAEARRLLDEHRTG